MAELSLAGILEILCVILTVVQFLSGFPVCIQMYKERSVNNVPFSIFLLATLTCLGMAVYGWRLDNPVVCYLNVFGFALYFLYVLMFVFVVESKGKYLASVVGAAAAVTFLYYDFTSGRYGYNEVTQLIGSYSSKVIILLVCLPFFELVGNVRNRNAEGVPLIMLMTQIASSTCWLIYGLLLNDVNIYLPNVPGLAIAWAKVGCFAAFGAPPKTKQE